MEEGCFIGYAESLYKIYDIKTKQIFISCDVIFQETPIHLLPESSDTSNHSPDLSECNTHASEQVQQEECYTPIDFLQICNN